MRSRFSASFYTNLSYPVPVDPEFLFTIDLILLYLALAYSFLIFYLAYRFVNETRKGSPFTLSNSRRLYRIGILVTIGPVLNFVFTIFLPGGT